MLDIVFENLWQLWIILRPQGTSFPLAGRELWGASPGSVEAGPSGSSLHILGCARLRTWAGPGSAITGVPAHFLFSKLTAAGRGVKPLHPSGRAEQELTRAWREPECMVFGPLLDSWVPRGWLSWKSLSPTFYLPSGGTL